MYGVCTPKDLVRLLETACVGCLVLTSLFIRPLTSSVALLYFQIILHLSAPSELEPHSPCTKRCLFGHTFPSLEHSSLGPCRGIRLIVGPRLDLYLPRPHPRTISPSVTYFNAQVHLYGYPRWTIGKL
ncbi:hypothetical protein C8R48DRAFT_409237 [Suillus tomentosus]|nr:hypothetical protein C8R48DRAFT_409237 [Suillus tomentosus]